MSTLPQELVIISWKTMNRAEKVLQELQQLNATHMVHLKYAEVITKDTQGRVTAQVKAAPVTKSEGAIAGAVAGGLLGMLVQHFTQHGQKNKGILQTADDVTTTIGVALGAGAGIAAVGAFEHIVPQDVVKAVEQQLVNKSSALIAVVHIDDLPHVLAALKAYSDGTIIQTTLAKEVVQQLATLEERA